MAINIVGGVVTCPNGCEIVIPSKSTFDVRKGITRIASEFLYEQERADRMGRTITALRGHITRLKKKVRNGR